MDTSKISFGEMIAGAAAVVLFIVMFFPWYGANIEGFSAAGGNATAWQAFSFIDILLFLAVVVTVGLVAARAADALPTLPQPPGLIIAAAGALALLLILFRLVVTPGGDLPDEIDVTRKLGLFLGLIAAGGLTFGGWTAMNERASGQAPPG